MSDSAPAIRSVPRLSAAVVLPVALLAAGLLWILWLLRTERAAHSALRVELTALRIAQRTAASKEHETEAALRRVARLEEALRMMPHAPAPAPVPAPEGTAELESVIRFLREEIKAAHETIDRLKQEDPLPKPK